MRPRQRGTPMCDAKRIEDLKHAVRTVVNIHCFALIFKLTQ